MSLRSLIEINHDFTWRLDDPEFVDLLCRYLSSGDRRTADDLRRFGVTVISQRHHSADYHISGRPDGFGRILDANDTQPKDQTNDQ